MAEPAPINKLTVLYILKRKAFYKPELYHLVNANIQELFTHYGKAQHLQATEVVKAYASWVQLRGTIHCSHLELCRLWFVCEMGYCSDEEQAELEYEFFK